MGGGASVSASGNPVDDLITDHDLSSFRISKKERIRVATEVQYSSENSSKLSVWTDAVVELSNKKIIVSLGNVDTDSSFEMQLHGRPHLSIEKVAGSNYFIVTARQHDDFLRLKAITENEAHQWLKILRKEIMKINADILASSENALDTIIQQFKDAFEYEHENHKDPTTSTPRGNFHLSLSAPIMNIVILVVGTRGDVQPFIYLGQALKKDGHRVRLATHADYRNDVTVQGGLEYYPLAGDPRKLSEYMVKSGGRLIPDLLNEEELRELPEKMQMQHDICFSCFPACTAPDPEDPEQLPFVADAIISNPVTYGHVHCAEALCVPLVNSLITTFHCFII